MITDILCGLILITLITFTIYGTIDMLKQISKIKDNE
jgi:hypothetical protein